MDLRSVFLILAATLAISLATTNARAQDESEEQSEPTATAEPSPGDGDKGADKAARARANNWWNVDAVVDALKLSAEQRQQMDDLRVANQEQSDAQAKSRRELEQQVATAFLSGDLGKARTVDDELTQQTTVKDNALKFEVLSQLSEEQIEVLKTQYPQVLSESWRRNTRRLVEADGKRGKDRNKQGDRDAKREQREAKRVERQQQQTEQTAAEPAAEDD